MVLEGEDDIPILIEVQPSPEIDSKRVPITLICGFLGAGKSTFLKWILTERHGYRIAVIMNEFGDTADIEAKSINVTSPEDSRDSPGQLSEEFLELANGCLCCSIKDSGIAAIEQLMLRKGAFDYILLETTGLADPGPIAATFWQNEEFATDVGKEIYLDGVICVVDAVFFEKQIKEDTESEGIKHSFRQIAASDVLLLNKSDLVSETDLARTESELKKLNPTVPIYRTVRGNVDLTKVIGIDAYGDRVKDILQNLAPRHGHDQEDDFHNHKLHDHDGDHDHQLQGHAGISNLVIHIPEPLSDTQITLIEEWIRSILWEGVIPSPKRANFITDLPRDLMVNIGRLSAADEIRYNSHPSLEVLRCKGIWWNERGEQFMLQGVRNMYEITMVDVRAEEQQEIASKVVFIGKGLNKEVKDSFVTAVMEK